MSFLDPTLDQVQQMLQDGSGRYSDVPMSDVQDGSRPAVTSKEDERDSQPAEEMDDLFGNDRDVHEEDPGAQAIKSESGAASPSPSARGSEDLSPEEKVRRQALEYAEHEEPGAIIEEVREADVLIPNIPVPRSSDGDYWVIRMPNFVKVDSKPFHPDTYMGPEDEESQQAESLREKSMTIKLKVENTLRWRWIKDESEERRQSNSRVIRWSDGTLSLRLGKELFDITQTIDTSGAISRTLGGSQSQNIHGSSSQSQSTVTGTKSHSLNYLVAQHKRSEVLQAEAVVTGYMSLRPTGMQSETHRMLVRAVGQKHNKVARLRMAPDPTMDPEREKMELMKLSAKKSKRKAEDGGFGGRRRKMAGARKRSGHDMWSDDEEPDYEASEEEGGGDVTRSAKKKADGERKKGPGEYQEDDFVVADDSDEEAEDDDGAKKKRKHREDADEEDNLDRLEAELSAQENDRKRRHPSEDEDDADEQVGGGDMEVESEEDEEDDEEHKVRRAGAGSRKKRALEFEEEEDE